MRSPSETGLRIILFVENSYNYDKNNYYIKKGDIEVYVSGATNRFVTITGNVYLDNEIVENTDPVMMNFREIATVSRTKNQY